MTHLLVVDDSPVARRTIERILGPDPAYQLTYADSGEDALQSMPDATPALVLMDSGLLELDGFQFLEEARGKYPHVPVVLMTSKGSEDVAVQALRAGATSYVPKSLLETDLADTVRTVLAVSGPARSRQRLKQEDQEEVNRLAKERSLQRLLQQLKQSEFVFALENDPALIPALITYLQDCLVQRGLFDEGGLICVGMALEEALVNAMYHGNLEVSSELRSQGDGSTFYALLRERRDSPPYSQRVLHVRAAISQEQVRFTIRDEGPGFDPSTLPDPSAAPNLERVSGRGVMLLRTFMDSVQYSATGNEVTLVKRCAVGGVASDRLRN